MMNEAPDTGNYELALALAKYGYIPVAILPGLKVPAEKRWQEWMHRSVTEESIAERWQGTRHGIALLCKDLLVLDVDHPALLDMVLDRCGLTEDQVPICKTPRGGYHVHARVGADMEVRATIKLRGEALDLLTGPRLSILPPHTNGQGVAYEWLAEGLPPKAELPIAEVGWMREHRQPRQVETPIASECNAHSLLSRGQRYVDRFERAVSGQRGHTTTFIAALKIARFVHRDPALTWQLLLYFNATKCDPEWSERELRHKWEDALEKAR